MTIKEKLRKVKSCRHVDHSRVAAELDTVSSLMHDPLQAMQSSYNLHKVPVEGVFYMAADAKVLNRHTNQSGRGNMRYLFDMQSRVWTGIAQEIDSGSYRRIA